MCNKCEDFKCECVCVFIQWMEATNTFLIPMSRCKMCNHAYYGDHDD